MKKLSTNSKFGLITGCTGLTIGLLLFFFGDKENPVQLTKDRLQSLEQEVNTFIEENRRPPTSLTELAIPAEELRDHLGEPFMYHANETSVIILSFGSDKKPGGTSFRRDYRVVIDLPNTD